MGKCLRHKEEGSIRIRLGSLRRGRSKRGIRWPACSLRSIWGHPAGEGGSQKTESGTFLSQRRGAGWEGSEQGAEWAGEWQEEPVRCARAPREEAAAGLR